MHPCEHRSCLTLDTEQITKLGELSELIRWHNDAVGRLKEYRDKYPYLLPPNVVQMIEGNLKENLQMLYRELNELNKPQSEKRRFVCRECHSVFGSPLPGGICDECRSKIHHTPTPDYGPRQKTQSDLDGSNDPLELQNDLDVPEPD